MLSQQSTLENGDFSGVAETLLYLKDIQSDYMDLISYHFSLQGA